MYLFQRLLSVIRILNELALCRDSTKVDKTPRKCNNKLVIYIVLSQFYDCYVIINFVENISWHMKWILNLRNTIPAKFISIK